MTATPGTRNEGAGKQRLRFVKRSPEWRTWEKLRFMSMHTTLG
jgi:hypothetical protein